MRRLQHRSRRRRRPPILGGLARHCHSVIPTHARTSIVVRLWLYADIAARKVYPEGRIYSYWDYRGLSFPKNSASVIDSASWRRRHCAERCHKAEVDAGPSERVKADPITRPFKPAGSSVAP